jgi:hypothetical protein
MPWPSTEYYVQNSQGCVNLNFPSFVATRSSFLWRYFATLWVTTLYGIEWQDKRLTGKNLEGIDHVVIRSSIPVCSWREKGRPPKYARQFSLRLAEVRFEFPQHKNLKHYRYVTTFRSWSGYRKQDTRCSVYTSHKYTWNSCRACRLYPVSMCRCACTVCRE